ncbi:MAG: hypothetical protein SO116_07215 [Treponema sp.]|nr:hypothetical protein [Spirochaetia bacterium]MDD7014769.1 hypothetical protein [Spirochaetales bacterium]MDY4902647.1 hypothetical protein [Treponema sp.]
MKRPENFNAGATVKKEDPLAAAISNNFSTQKAEQSAETQVKQQSVQEKQTETKQETSSAAETNASENHAETERKSASKREVKEKFLVSMSKGERSIFKAFCAMKSVSMNHFVMCAMDYFKEDLEKGKVTISPHSYKRQEI